MTTSIEKKYQKLTQLEHILKKPGMYIGGTDPVTERLWVLDNDSSIIEKDITYSPGLYKIFDEIIVNAYDQTIRDITLRTIKVSIDVEKNEISVHNDGHGIDVVIHKDHNIYVPELIFGHLLTSTNFSDEEARITGGTHGLGAKLTAVFSTYFKVEVGDPKNKKSFVQIYEKNLHKKSKPKVSSYNKSNGYVKITFRPDLDKFKLKSLDLDIVSLMLRRVYDLAALTRKNVKVYLNSEQIGIKSLEDYVKLFLNSSRNEDDKSNLSNLSMISIKCDEDSVKYEEDRWNVIVTSSANFDSENSKSHNLFKCVSFVNGIYTSKNGHHVDHIVRPIVKGIRSIIESKFKTDRIKDSIIKDQLAFFISASIENPSFSSQTKEELMTPMSRFGSTCVISDKYIKKIYQSLNLHEIFDRQIQVLRQMDMKSITVKKKSNIKNIPKLNDANYAGTSKSNECTLILTEGDSAKSMAISGLSVIPKASNYYGVFPLKGKLINVREAPHKKIIKNEEFKNLKSIIGLRSGEIYDSENINDLRYGSIVLMMDADVDGSHIKGLFINMIEHYWPSLLKIDGFIKIFITPMVKVSKPGKSNKQSREKSKSKTDSKDKGKKKTETSDNVEWFYTMDAYNKWRKKNQDANWKVKYYKGLGTNTSAEAKEYFSKLGKHLLEMNWDNKSKDSIELAFSKDRVSDRKDWLKKYNPEVSLDYQPKERGQIEVTYTDFIHKELIHFSNYDNHRSIPHMIDGLKPSQRKIMYSMFKKNQVTEIKVANLVGYVSDNTAYHHGEMSLVNTIIGLAQDFVGSNNINLLDPRGQFGTRLMGGKDSASSRYIFTLLMSITRLIFRKEDDPILEYLEDDGMSIEPLHYVPIIPMILVNGAEGIGTGYRSSVPSFNPSDIIENILRLMDGQKLKEIKPYYRGFEGDITKESKEVYYTKGKYIKDVKNKNIVITELPIGVWTEKYVEFLASLVENESRIKDYKALNTDTKVNIIIKFDSAETIEELEATTFGGDSSKSKVYNGLEKLLNLYTTINLGNINLYNEKSEIKNYPDPLKLIKEFYDVRLKYYEIRKDYQIKVLEEQVKILASKTIFIDGVINNKIKIMNVPNQEVIKKLESLKLHKVDGDYKYLIKMPMDSLTEEKVSALKQEFSIKNKELTNLRQTNPIDIWRKELTELREKLNE